MEIINLDLSIELRLSIQILLESCPSEPYIYVFIIIYRQTEKPLNVCYTVCNIHMYMISRSNLYLCILKYNVQEQIQGEGSGDSPPEIAPPEFCP